MRVRITTTSGSTYQINDDIVWVQRQANHDLPEEELLVIRGWEYIEHTGKVTFHLSQRGHYMHTSKVKAIRAERA